MNATARACAVVAGLALSGVLLFLAARGVDGGELRRTIEGAHLGRLVLAVAAIGAMYVLQAYRWRRLASREVSLPLRRFLAYTVAGLACNNVAPGRVGDLMRAHWLSRATGVPRSRALATVVADRVSDLLVLVGLLLVTASIGPRPAWLERIDLVAAAGVVFVVALAAGARAHARRPGTHEALGRVGRPLAEGALALSRTATTRDLPVIAATSVAAWAAWCSSAWLAASSLGVELTMPQLLFVAAVVNLGVAVPSSPGSLGTYQWLWVASLGLLAVERADALAFSIVFHAVWYVPTTLAGLALGALGGASVALATVRARQQPVGARP